MYVNKSDTNVFKIISKCSICLLYGPRDVERMFNIQGILGVRIKINIKNPMYHV